MVVVVNAAVLNDPVVPEPPPPEEVQEVLLVDVQLIVDFAPYAIDDGVAVKVTAGAAAATLTVVLWLAIPPGPVHNTV